MRIVFMGTPEFSVPTLAHIIAAGHRVVAVYSQPPRPAGRGLAEIKAPVHRYADEAGLTVRTPRTLRDPLVQSEFAALAAEVAVVVAYGLILPKPILEAPRHGCLNMHASALPRWRGAAPIQRAIMAGDTGTAVSVMRMEEGLDTGPVCMADAIDIDPDTTNGELHDAMSAAGARIIVRALAELEHGRLSGVPQSTSGVTYAAKIDKAEAQIDFSLSATEIHNRVRGLSPWPGAWFALDNAGRSERIKVLRTMVVEGRAHPGTVLDDRMSIACGTAAVRLLQVQRAGKRPVSAEEFLRGFSLPVGSRLTGC